MKINKTILSILITLISTLASVTAIADIASVAEKQITAGATSKWCKGKIRDVWVQKQGYVYIYGQWRKQHTMICSIKSPWKGVEPEICNAWLGLAQQANATQTDVVIRYDDISSCSSIPHFTLAPSPAYIMLRQ